MFEVPDWLHAQEFGSVAHYDFSVPDDPNEVIFFYGGEFSNFWPSPIMMVHPWRQAFSPYRTVEHWFAANKGMDEFAHDYVQSADSPLEAKMRGRSVDLALDWDVKKYNIMLAGVREKFKNRALASLLFRTGERYIAEDSPTDPIWGLWNHNTGRYNGLNLLGDCLMKIRKEF